MERPRLRALEVFVLEQEGERLLALRDPSGMSDAMAALPPLAVAVLELCDGERTRDEICVEFTRRHGTRLERGALDGLMAQLDEALLLDSDRYQRHAAALLGEFARSPVRPAHLAGRGYSDNPLELGSFLDRCFDPPSGPGRPPGRSGPTPHAIIAPHIDFVRGGPAYAWAYRGLAEAADVPELILILGTDHNSAQQPFTFTRKHYQTPLGTIETDVEAVEALTARLEARQPGAAAALFAEEHHHRAEHSIEFQVVWLMHVLGERAARAKVLPILCGGLHELIAAGRDPALDPLVAAVLEELTALARARHTLWVAGADLAHVGPRFGDAEPLAAAARDELRRADEASLAAAAAGDAGSWFRGFSADRDRRRVCGVAPIYALLAGARPAAGQVLTYAQCPADESGGSLVSIASVCYGAASREVR